MSMNHFWVVSIRGGRNQGHNQEGLNKEVLLHAEMQYTLHSGI